METDMITGPQSVLNAFDERFNSGQPIRTYYCEESFVLRNDEPHSPPTEEAKRQIGGAIASSLWDRSVGLVSYHFSEEDNEMFIQNAKKITVGVLVGFTDLADAGVGEFVLISAFDSKEHEIEIVEPNGTFRRFRRVARGKRPPVWLRIV